METPFTLTIHGVTIVGILSVVGLGITAVRKLQKLLDIFEQFPPHNHVNGSIQYPKGFQPGEIRPLKTRGPVIAE